ncbi:unnamed protein product [Linum trigynum]|uniref:Uncharacterized protein n=1 Tax=Linum trigynum TaxID=586398 RepID=A0AAV2F9M3_9ROSI
MDEKRSHRLEQTKESESGELGDNTILLAAASGLALEGVQVAGTMQFQAEVSGRSVLLLGSRPTTTRSSQPFNAKAESGGLVASEPPAAMEMMTNNESKKKSVTGDPQPPRDRDSPMVVSVNPLTSIASSNDLDKEGLMVEFCNKPGQFQVVVKPIVYTALGPSPQSVGVLVPPATTESGTKALTNKTGSAVETTFTPSSPDES